MRRVEVPGGWYGEALPTGEYAVAIRDQKKVKTHLGMLDVEHDLLFVRVSAVGGFRFAGQDQAGGGNFEYRDGKPIRVGDSFGVNPVLYLSNGTLLQCPVGESHQGYRFQDLNGRIWTGDETYNDPVDKLSEWTQLGGVLFGQGQSASAGAIVQINGKQHVLEPGFCYFIRVQISGDQFAIAIVKLQEKKTVLLWMSRQELEQLPLVGEVINPPPPPVYDPPPPAPPQSPMDFPNHLDVVQQVCAAHPDLVSKMDNLAKQGEAVNWDSSTGGIQAEHSAVRFQLLLYIAYAVNQVDPDFGLERKDGGTNGAVPGTGLKSAVQILMHKPTGRLVQVTNDHAGEWAPLVETDTRDPKEFWIQPPRPADVQPPVPPPTPPQPPTDPPPTTPDDPSPLAMVLVDLEEKVTEIQAEVQAVEDQMKKGFKGTSKVFGTIDITPK